MLPPLRTRPLELEGCIFQRLAVENDRIELELYGLTLALPAPAEVERIAVVCSTARLLSSADELRAIEAAPEWYRKIAVALLLKEDIVYLALTGGACLIVECQALRIERASLSVKVV